MSASKERASGDSASGDSASGDSASGDSASGGAPLVRYSVVDAVATIRLDNPRTLNALDGAMQDQIGDALERAAADPAVRAVVLTGGTRVFASGADINELGRTDPVTVVGAARRRLWDQVAACPKPLVAAVAGYVLGGGCELALACDLVVAGDRAVLGQPEARLGISPGAGGVQRWGRVTGRFVAAEVAMAGRRLSAWEAFRAGLVNRVVPQERTVAAAQQLAAGLAAGAPLALQAIKRGVAAVDQMPMAAGLELDRSLMALLLSTADAAEGIAAFTERRPPRFAGE